MGVIQTNQWLDNDFNDILAICRRLKESFQGADENEIFHFLSKKGLYKPTFFSKIEYHKLKKLKVWDKIQYYYRLYKKKWDGPNIPIYIFPIHHSYNQILQKTGITFHDKIILFLSPLEDEREYEAIFVHEYHHATRLNKMKKPLSDYTFLDSMVMEGLAENAVEEYCGSKYLAKWCLYYSGKTIEKYWDLYLLNNLNIKLDHPLHDALLYGKRHFPKMVGYAAGYYLIYQYKQRNHFSTIAFLDTPSETFLLDKKRRNQDLDK